MRSRLLARAAARRPPRRDRANDLDRQWVYWLGAWLLTCTSRRATASRAATRTSPFGAATRFARWVDLLRSAGLRPVRVRACVLRPSLRDRGRAGMTDRAGLSGRVVDVAVVGGGPAGAALAARLARRGFDVAVFERSHGMALARVRRVQLAGDAASSCVTLGVPAEVLAAVARPIPRLWVDAPGGASFR